MHEFKVGDLVRRISNNGSRQRMPIGAVYRVTEVYHAGSALRLAGDDFTGVRRAKLFERAYIESKEDMDKLYE